MKKLKTQNELIECPRGCGKMCKGEQGVKTHVAWAHNRLSRARRMAAAKEVGLAKTRRFALPPEPELQNGADKPRRPYARRGSQQRRYTKRGVARRILAGFMQQHDGPELNFCPKCRCDLRSIQAVIKQGMGL